MSVSRRNFLKGTAAGAAGTALSAGVLAGGARADARSSDTQPTAAAAATPSTGRTRPAC